MQPHTGSSTGFQRKRRKKGQEKDGDKMEKMRNEECTEGNKTEGMKEGEEKEERTVENNK